ncbi:hypothetical protein [Stappia sp. ES.058]|uniref:hypothetical protein n=1 Tax=Stappia sp. ES.058 TaxID=1881061 RepID=UPI00087B0095|nr:hypothetical protein [Stappia sp. ES.058]SDT97133.1 hypothetical protein SAMN05428979_0815 [Stappia sp. ES.058]
MSAKRNQVGIRLVALNGKAVERELKKFGAEGQSALDRIQKASKPARAGLKAVDSGVGELKTRMTGLANSAGPVGTALMALGPAGTAAAVGIGALGLAFTKALAISRDAVRDFDALAKRARTLGLSTDLFQALQLAAEEQGIAQQSLNVALQTFATRSGEAANATGTLYSRLKQINPELLAQFQAAATGEERLKLLAAAVQDLVSAEERAALTAAAFGQRNVDLVRILADTGESIDDLIRRAKDLGVVVEEQMLKRAEEMENQFGVAARVIDINLKQAFVDLAPILISTLELFAEMAKATRYLSDLFREMETRSTATLETHLEDLSARRDALRKDLEGGGLATLGGLMDGAVEREIAGIDAEIKRIDAILEARKKVASPSTANIETGPTAEDRAKAAAWRERLLTIDEKRAQVMAEIDRLETTGALTSSEAAMARMKAEADLQKLIDKGRKTKTGSDKESVAMLREVTRLLDAARTPAEDLEKRLARIAELQAGGTFDQAAPGQGAEMAKRARVIAMREYLAAAEDTEEALRRIKDIAANGVGANRVAAEIALAERAGKSFGETMEKVSDGIADSLTDAIFEAKNLGDALQTLARQIMRDFVNAQFRRMLGGGSGSGGIFGAIGSFVSGLFGGGVTAAVRHEGGPVGGAGPTRNVSASVFDGAPRRHEGGGLRPGERPVIALEDEYVMTRAMQGDLVNTLRGLGALASARPTVSPAPVVNVITPPGHTAETRESRSASGGMQIDVIVKPLERALAKNMREGGPLRDAIGGTFGLNRANGLT